MIRPVHPKASASGKGGKRAMPCRHEDCARKSAEAIMDLIEAAWDREGLTPAQRLERFENGMKIANESAERRRGH